METCNENNVIESSCGTPKVIPSVREDIKPFIGKEFNSIDEAFTFYNAYARVCGFSVRKGTQRCSTKEPVAIWCVLLCSKEGERDEKHDKQKKAKTRVGCLARLEVRRKKDSNDYHVTKFIEEHNHVMMTPSKIYLLRSQRNMDEGAKQLIRKWNEAGLGTPNIMSILSNEAGGVRGIGFDEDQCRSYIKQIKRRMYRNDGQCLMNYFMHMRNKNPSFYFDMQIDEEGQIGNCFWVDAQARVDYFYFGDVVIFDTTYKTNKYLMPFAPFTGVNNHKQSILFGCALLVDETEKSFKWLFQTWLKAMEGKAPKAIITD